MGAAKKVSRAVVLRIALLGVLTAGLAGCTVLPKGSLDPASLILGLPRAENGPAQSPSEAPAPAGAPGVP